MKKVYLKGLFSIFVTLAIVSCKKKTITNINNEYVSVKINKGKIDISSSVNNELKASFKVLGEIELQEYLPFTDDIWGKGKQLVFLHGDRKGYKTTIALYSGNPFVHLSTTICNNEKEDVVFSELDIGTISLSVGSEFDSLNTLGTGGLKTVKNSEGSYLYSMLSNPENRNSILTGWLTQSKGVGTFYPKITTENDKIQSYELKAGLEFGHFKIKKEEKRSTDTMILGFFNDGREGLELYGNHLAKAYNINLPKKPEVYCTWYHRDLNGSGASTEEDLKENVEYISENLADFGLNTIQIDDHWQSSLIKGLNYKNKKEFKEHKLGGGPIKTFAESNFNYPSGMRHTANAIIESKLVPGIWFMPFSGDKHNSYFNTEIFATDAKTGLPFEAKKWSGTIIDATNPKGEMFLRERFKRLYNWGYRYFKIDGLHTGAPSENVYVNRSYNGVNSYANAKIYNDDLTFTECFRRGITILKEEAPDAFLLGCTITQNMSAFTSSIGAVHAMRVGPDNDTARNGDWKNITKGADYAGNLYFLNNKVWYNDPDPYYVRNTNPLNKARWMVSWQAVSGVMGTSSMQYANLTAERLNLIKRALPTHNLTARPVDILENEKPKIWMVQNDRLSIVGLFNWYEQKETKIEYSLDKLGLDISKQYGVFDFWKNKYLGKINEELTSTLAPASCQILALKEIKSYPQVISTSRHITQGLIDIVNESWNTLSKTLSGTSKVVKGDSYELRVILPEDGGIPKTAMCDGKAMDVVLDGEIARLTYLPEETGNVNWKIRF
ncbi:hypothetical protein KFZ70_09235 [Tamlana fucoidanivorans]|uniref:Alpha galactosidase C-terminal domain-containing protein n=1 Tax=Allotamlana fucoidanivorans TaxID=2583814 RepID=A0A5C4SP59_9FLAO|nr:hypothetical protein [Tamlana fucoidanivorans]TNJ46064.1 hypothetical protein FGF67_03450 [Tamlana fucoidanivorans]